MIRPTLTIAVFAFACLICSFSQADDISTLYNTGVDEAGMVLAEDAPAVHWALVDPSPQVGAPLVATSAGGFPVPPWLGDNDQSAWIGTLNPDASGPGSHTDIGEFADYHYQTTFSMDGLIPDTAVIEGRVGYDNFLQDVLINGSSTGISYPVDNPGNGFADWNPFALEADDIDLLSEGENTMTFIVRSAQADGADDFTSLRVEFTTATANAIPEPASWLTLLLGIAGLSGLRRRRAHLVAGGLNIA